MTKQGQGKKAIVDIFSLPENNQNFELFYRFLSQSLRGMALCRVFPEERLRIFGFFNRDKLREYIRVIDLVAPLCTPLDLQKTITRLDREKPKKKKIFFIYNIESCIYLLKISREEFFQRLNLIRDFFMGFNAIFVFFVTESSLKTMIRNAFDFYDWISFTFSFENENRALRFKRPEEMKDKDAKYSNLHEKIEYLEKSLEKITDEKEKSLRLFELSGLFRHAGDYDTALEKTLESLNIDETNNDTKEIGKKYSSIGILYKDKGELEKALEFQLKALNIAKNNNNLVNIMYFYNSIGEVYLKKGDLGKALEFFRKALDIAEKNNYPVSMARYYNNIGIVYKDEGNLDKALKFIFKSLRIFEEHNDLLNISATVNNIGQVYRDKGDFDKALDFTFKALDIETKLNDQKNIGIDYNNLGQIYRAKGDLEEALEYYSKSLEIAEKNNDLVNMEIRYNNMGLVYKAKGDKKRAAEYFKLAEETGKRLL